MAYSADPKKPAPEYLARKGEGAMDDEEFAAVVQNAIAQSVSFGEELSIDRAKATDYYNGKPFGNEEEGRSQVVLTEVRDAADGMTPSLARVFFGAEHAVEFVPTRADNVEQAAQKTDYVRYVFEEDNAGLLRSLDVLKDGLVRRIGIFKWGWDDAVDTKAYKQEGITQQELELLASDDSVDLKKVTPRKVPKAGPGEPPPAPLFDVDLTRTVKEGRAWVDSVPPEEFGYNRQARRLDKALLVYHRTEKTRGQLLAMGVSKNDIEEHASASAGSDISLTGSAEATARQDVAVVGNSGSTDYTTDPDLGTANDKVLYTEAWMTVDYDGDGIAELRRICTIGPTYYPVKNDPCDEIPFAIFTPYPEPHALLGGSVADRTMDVQRINSSILRSVLDSGSASIFPRTVYVEGQASVADIMNVAIGAPIRERVAGAVRTLDVPFTGREMLPVLQFMQEVIERRTGRNKGAAGLDADALQSTGKEAVGAVLTGSQEQIELIARVFAETLKTLFRGLGRLIQSKQPRERMVRLRGKWVDVDPRQWDANMDVTVNVALGTTSTEKKIAVLMAVAADQKEIAAATGGLNSPVMPFPKIMNTRSKILALQGIKDFGSYYPELPPDWQPPAPQPAPDPEAGWIQAEKEMNHVKTMKELAIKQDEITLKREQQTWQQSFEIQKLATDAALRKYATDAQFHSTMTQAEMDANIESEAREAELTMQGHGMLHDQMLDRAAHAHEVEMGTRAADTADAAVAAQPEPGE